MEDKPLRFFDQCTKPGERVTDKPELPQQGLAMHIAADLETIEGEVHLKLGKSRGFEIYSDEPPHIGGTSRYPPPMRYLAMGIGFWPLTQVMRYASMMKLKIKKANCHVEFDYVLSGSVLKGTVKTTWHGVSTSLDIDSD